MKGTGAAPPAYHTRARKCRERWLGSYFLGFCLGLSLFVFLSFGFGL
eukprot:SAG31_NODE_23599_length_501_cov_0.452736_2_plen_46_part_01